MNSFLKKPKVLLVTSDPAPWGLLAFYHRALVKLGYEASYHLLLGGNANNVYNRLIKRLPIAYHLKLKLAHKSLLSEAKAFRPDLIIITKGTELNGDLLGALKELTRALIFNIYTDSPFVYPGYPELLSDSFRSLIKSFDCVFTFARFLMPIFYQCGAKRVEHLPFAHDPEIHRPVDVSSTEMENYRSPVAYLGTWGPAHEKWLELLEPYGLKIWGLQWNHLPPSSLLRRCVQSAGSNNHGLGLGMSKVCGASNLIFNTIRAEHGCAHSMKTFEIPACRGFMISNRTDEQLEYFEEDRAAVYFSSPDELLDKVRFYLANEEAREKIAINGYKEALKHTYSDRLQKVLSSYEELRREL